MNKLTWILLWSFLASLFIIYQLFCFLLSFSATVQYILKSWNMYCKVLAAYLCFLWFQWAFSALSCILTSLLSDNLPISSTFRDMFVLTEHTLCYKQLRKNVKEFFGATSFAFSRFGDLAASDTCCKSYQYIRCIILYNNNNMSFIIYEV
jgi:hypothetical protein